MEQVRERAQQKAREILQQALTEAEAIRAQAKAEGYAAGQQAAKDLVQKEKQKSVDFLLTLQQALAVERERIFQQHKQTLFQILRLAFEKSFGTVLEERRFEVLSALFEEAVAQIQAQSIVTMYVCPSDAEHAAEMLRQAKAAKPDLPEISIHTSPEVAPGGLRLESGDGLIDNTIASRFEQVCTILDGYLDSP